MQAEKPERLLLPVKEAAQMLSIAPLTLREMIARGELPAVRIGRRGVRVSVEGLRAWIGQQTTQAARQ